MCLISMKANKNIKSIPWDIILKALKNAANEDERYRFNTWIEANDRHRCLWNELHQAWNDVREFNTGFNPDASRAWQQVVEKTKNQYLKQTRIIPLYWRAVAVAAAIFLIAGALYLGLRDSKIEQGEAAYNIMYVPVGQRSQIALADGTSVWLNSGSRLQFPASFETDSRMVKLEGEAWFEVATDKNKPFVVQTLGLEVTVYGTSFNLTSYPNDAFDVVTLMSGSVSVASLGSGKEIFLQPGQQISYLRNEHLFADPLLADRETETAWRDGRLVFDDMPLGELAKKLERRYGVTIRIEGENIEQLRFRGVFRRESLEQAIRALQLTAKFQYKIENDVVIVY